MRAVLSEFEPAGASHAGHLLGPLFDGSEKEARGEFLRAATRIKLCDAYEAAFETWKAATNPTITATTSGLLAIGLGNASPTEVGLTLHRIYGLPYLPGSALKGLAVRAARDHQLSAEACAVLFGNTDSAAYVIWWDGWLDPACTAPLQRDTITVHHQKYYGQNKDRPFPTDFDDPNPVAFLSVPIGTKFHLALSGTQGLDPQWLRLAAELLEYGLSKMGLGGKTNAGYGGFEVVLPEKPKSQAELGREAEAATNKQAEKWLGEVAKLNGPKMKQEAPRIAHELAGRSEAVRVKVGQALLARMKQFGADKKELRKVEELLRDEA